MGSGEDHSRGVDTVPGAMFALVMTPAISEVLPVILDPPPTTLPRRRAPRPGLTVRTDNGVPGVARVVLAGEIDAATVPDIRAALAAHGHDQQVTVDLRQVTFCDVAGLRALLEADATLRAGQGALVLTGPCPSVQALLDLLGPETTLAITAAPSD